ncbi:MAG: glycosidase [candidate division KSB1 bacterium]|nr:glycosidase [candidate division KSB1 bacterium]MDZ7313676.1 glycosidase [candidate division KSB1 bacterium]
MFKLQPASKPILGPLKEHAWESQAVFNPAAIRDGEYIHMVYRAVEGDNYSTLGYAKLDRTGKILERWPEPILRREAPYEKRGVEDPRMTRHEGRYYLVYVAYDSVNVRVCLASTTNFKKIERHGIIIPEVWDKDAMFFPEPVKGKLVLMHRIEPDIQLAFFNDIEHLLRPEKNYWQKHIAELDKYTAMRPQYWWEAKKIGGGAPPIPTTEGWLVIYHGVDERLVYRAGAALLDFDNPLRVIARFPEPILAPERQFEKIGDVPNVVFPTGTALFDDELLVFYGGADKTIGMATASLAEILHELLRHKI